MFQDRFPASKNYPVSVHYMDALKLGSGSAAGKRDSFRGGGKFRVIIEDKPSV